MFEKQNAPKIKKLVVLQYTFIDDHSAILKPEQIFNQNSNLEHAIESVKKSFIEAGWEGDGTIGLIWIPPFLDQASEDNFGDYIWHVKQSNNGISFLGFFNPIQSAKLLDQNKYFVDDGKQIKPIHILYNENEWLVIKLQEIGKLLIEIEDSINKNAIKPIINEISLYYIQNEIIGLFSEFIDDCYLNFLIHVLNNNNPDSIKLKSFSVKLDLTSLSETSDKIPGSHWLTINQIISYIWKDFKFQQFKERFNEIQKSIDYIGNKKYIDVIYKHVVIRNCIQHHNCVLEKTTLKPLGANRIEVLDNNGKKVVIKEWEKIIISVNEVKLLNDTIITFVNEYAKYVKERIKERHFLHNFVKKEDI